MLDVVSGKAELLAQGNKDVLGFRKLGCTQARIDGKRWRSRRRRSSRASTSTK